MVEDHPIVINTSTLSITELAAQNSCPERIVGMHFLYPVTTTRVVEVVRGQLTTDEVYKRAVTFARILGKVPIKVFEMPGFVTTRVIMPLINEAMHTVMEGVAEAAEVDLAIKLGFNFTMGPLEWADRTGLDRVLNWMQHLHSESGEPRFRPCPMLKRLVRAGLHGAKTGQGFFHVRQPPPAHRSSPGRQAPARLTPSPHLDNGEADMKILVLNSGSSSVKFQVIETDLERMKAHEDQTLATGLVEKIGLSDSRLVLKVPDRKAFTDYREILEHRAAIEWVLRILADPEVGILDDVTDVGAVGHRVVHGGEAFASSVLITPEVVQQIEDCSVLAPLHNPPNLRGYYAAHAALPDVPHIAVFDTAFHQTMPPHAFLYGIPFQLYTKHALRKYGFHGTSHRYVAFRGSQILGWERREHKLITVHLGNGCSTAAIDHGKSIDTSMGFTPLEGLLMGTRTGDMDPAVVPWLMAMEEMTLHQVNTMMNKHSGLYGVSGVSSDMRELVEARANGHQRADVAFRMFCYRVKKYIGAYAAAMGGVDAVFFTGGIGENSPEVREWALSGLEYMGVEIDQRDQRRPARRRG